MWSPSSVAQIYPTSRTGGEVGSFHTHPSDAGYYPQPSPADINIQIGPSVTIDSNGIRWY